MQYKSSTITTWGRTPHSALDSRPRCTRIQRGLFSYTQSQHLIVLRVKQPTDLCGDFNISREHLLRLFF